MISPNNYRVFGQENRIRERIYKSNDEMYVRKNNSWNDTSCYML